MSDLLSYDAALAYVLDVSPLPEETIPLAVANGRVLSHEIVAPADLPPFDNSAVDGYAVYRADTANSSPDHPVILPVSETIAAGYSPVYPLASGSAARIYTGAPLPANADALVMVEDTETMDANRVRLLAPGSPGMIRHRGSDIARGQVALASNSVLNPGAIGLLAALNVGKVRCYRRPRVALLTTGDEVVPVGDTPLAPGQIRDANGAALAAAIADTGAELVLHRHARDTAESVRDVLTSAARIADVIVASGGVSVGDRDYIKTTLEEIGTLNFWRIAVRPGKPLAYGRIGDAVFFGLSGNPVSSLVTFELFVRPLLRKMIGEPNPLRPVVPVILTEPIQHEPGRREFIRANFHWEEGICRATPTGLQSSHRLSTMIGANSLLIAREEHGDYTAGETLDALLLTGS